MTNPEIQQLKEEILKDIKEQKEDYFYDEPSRAYDYMTYYRDKLLELINQQGE